MTMSFNLFGKKPLQNVNYKSRLEYKLYLAREDPEPVFDLTECNLKSVPSGIYSLCKVFRKERLLLQVNQLSSLSGGGQLSDLSLLTTLDLHKNRFSALPEDIGYLSNLQVLNLSSNELKSLPEAVGSLVKLTVLDCAHNKLRCLPPSLGQLTLLTSLDLRDNPSLLSLPPSLSQASSLQQLFVDGHSLQSPPPAVTGQGTTAVLLYLGRQCGTKFTPKSMIESAGQSQQSKMAVESSQLQDSLKLLEGKKEDKLQELLEVERNLQEQKSKEYEIHENTKQDRSKLLMSLKEQQKKLEEDVSRFQTQKEQERAKLLSHLLEVESQAEDTIGDLLALNQALHRTSQWQEQDQREQQLLSDYKSRSNELRRRQVIDAMESLLAEECVRKEKQLAYEITKSEMIQNSLMRDVEWGQQVSSLICDRNARQSALLTSVEADTEMQKALVATLLERSDLHTQSLVMQVALVQQQLAVLTAVELKRRNMDLQQHLNDLAEKRKTLSDLLVGLLVEQRERRKHLVDSLHQMETDRQVCESSQDFWLRQYQYLLDVRPPQLRTALDPELVHQVVLAGVPHCLPFLACCHIQSLTQSQLAQIGVTNEDEQQALLHAVNVYLTHKQAQLMPSAPPLLTREPLPECIVCMEAECAIVFVPCGHLCTCLRCATQLHLCPLCRASLQHKVHIIIP